MCGCSPPRYAWSREKYIAAALTMVRAHMVAGYPGHAKPLAGFAEWSRLVRGALIWLGRADPVATQEQLRIADPAAASLDLVMEAWAKALNDNQIHDAPMAVGEIIGSNNHDLLQVLRNVTHARDDLNVVKVGNFFKRYKNRRRKGARLIGEYDTHRKQQRWRLVGWQSLLGDKPEGTIVSLQERKGRKAVRRKPTQPTF